MQMGASLPLRREPTDLVDLVRRVAEEQQGPMGRAIDVTVPPTLLADVDPDRLARVVANLLSNALKYSAAETRVRVHLAREDAEVGEDSGVAGRDGLAG